MTFAEIGELTENGPAYAAITAWLNSEVEVFKIWESPRRDYIKAHAPIRVWERLLKAKYSKYQDLSKSEEVYYDIAAEYTMPSSLTDHVEYIFGTVQIPLGSVETPKLHNDELNGNRKVRVRTAATTPVTVSYLNSLYDISSNVVANPTFSQAVFETSNESFSQADLYTFQKYYGLEIKAADAPFGCSTTSNACASYGNCYEGNLDVQYIMGVAQNVSTVYWYTSDSDPFLAWILAVANATEPPLVNSISWGSIECVSNLDFAIAYV